MAPRTEELRLNYRCTRCLVNYQYPIVVDVWQETVPETDQTIIFFRPCDVQRTHECKERIR